MALENLINLKTLKLSSFSCFFFKIGDFTATPNFRKLMPKSHDEIS
jgi:hypothetical protein